MRDQSGTLIKIIEEKDCNKMEKGIKEINSGIYIFDNELLFDLLPKLDNNNAQSHVLKYFLYIHHILLIILKQYTKDLVILQLII